MNCLYTLCILAAAYLGSACSTTSTPESPTQPAAPAPTQSPATHSGLEGPWVFATPGDMMTSVATTLPRVVIRGLATTDGAKANSVEPFVSLVTWPELAAVSGVTKATRPDGTDFAVELSTTGALPDRWYAVRISGLPTGVRIGEGVHGKKLADGSHVVRFRPGSDPVVSNIQYCAKKDGKHSMLIAMSEGVLAAAVGDPVAITDAATGATSACRTGNDVSTAVQSLHVLCDAVPSELRLSIGSRLKAAGSTKAVAETHTFKLVDLPKTEGECRLFVP